LTEILSLYKNLLDIATTDFTTVVVSGEVKGKYSYHWDRSLSTGKIYRHDNAPHHKWGKLSTFPRHFHNGSEDIVVPSNIPEDPELALKEFLNFAIEIIVKNR
jgi:hypothetical protein